MLHELRLYHAMPGRLDELAERIGQVLVPYFARHGFPPRLGQWTVSAGASTPMLAWLLAWPGGLDQRTACFSALGADPDWNAVRIATNGNGEMVRRYDLRFLTPSPVSWDHPPDAPTPPVPVDASLFELRVHEVAVGSMPLAHEILTATHLPGLRECGATVLGVFDNQSGPATPGITLLLGWRTYEDRRQGLSRFESRRDARSGPEASVLGPCASTLLDATPYGHPNDGLRAGA